MTGVSKNYLSLRKSSSSVYVKSSDIDGKDITVISSDGTIELSGFVLAYKTGSLNSAREGIMANHLSDVAKTLINRLGYKVLKVDLKVTEKHVTASLADTSTGCVVLELVAKNEGHSVFREAYAIQDGKLELCPMGNDITDEAIASKCISYPELIKHLNIEPWDMDLAVSIFTLLNSPSKKLVLKRNIALGGVACLNDSEKPYKVTDVSKEKAVESILYKKDIKSIYVLLLKALTEKLINKSGYTELVLDVEKTEEAIFYRFISIEHEHKVIIEIKGEKDYRTYPRKFYDVRFLAEDMNMIESTPLHPHNIGDQISYIKAISAEQLSSKLNPKTNESVLCSSNLF